VVVSSHSKVQEERKTNMKTGRGVSKTVVHNLWSQKRRQSNGRVNFFGRGKMSNRGNRVRPLQLLCAPASQNATQGHARNHRRALVYTQS